MMVASWLLAGGAIGVLDGLSLRWTAARLRPNASSQVAVLALAGAMLRWGLAAAVLIAALQQGIASGLLAFAGLQLARWGVVCWFNWQA
jgi:hypothetical protein